MRPTVWRGMVKVDGLLLEREWRSRALRLWTPASRLEALDDGRILLTFAMSRSLRTDRAPGAPVVRAGAGWADHPGADPVDRGTVAVLEAGVPTSHRIVGPVDPGTLLDLEGWTVSTARRREEPPPPSPVTPSPTPEPAPIDARAELGGLPPVDTATRREWQDVVEDAGTSQMPSPRRRATPPQGRATSQHGAVPRRPPGRLRAWLDARRAASTASRHRRERYLTELDDLFQRGELEEALRRAIPLGGSPGTPTSSVPGRRAELAIDLHRTGSSRTVDVPPDMQRHLRDAYRAAHDQLDREGRTKEAAFVLADLLDDTPGACAYLERKGELRLAAALADARGTDHALTIRLWWKAGDRRRAITLARRHRAYAGAIARLERAGDLDDAKGLRRAWASDLDAAGDLLGTLDALEGCDDDASLAVRDRVMSLGLEATGTTRARMVSRALRAGHPASRDALDRVLSDDISSERRLIAEELTSEAAALPEPRHITPLVRRLLADDGHTRLVRELATISRDAVLEADLPTEVRDQAPPPDTLEVHLDDADRGLLPVRDARMLADGTVVAVLEEIGVRMLRPDGRRIVDLDLTVDFLVPSDSGGRVLAGRRLDPGAIALWEIGVWDRRSRPLGELAATAWTTSYDGSTWFIAHGDTLLMLDLIEHGPTALWAQAALGGPVITLARSPNALAVAVARDDADEDRLVSDCYVFDLPDVVGRTRRREVLSPGRDLLPDGTVMAGAIASDDEHVLVAPVPGDRVEAWSRRHRIRRLAVHESPDVPFTAAIDHGHLVLGDAAGRVERVDLASRSRLAAIRTTL